MMPLLFFALLYAALAWGWQLPWPVGAGYLALSAWTFAVYAADKSAARAQGRRVRERTLHLLALAGGWPGALCAQRWLRHKSAKAPFRAVFRLTVLGNVALLVLLSSPAGGHWDWLR